MAQNVLVRNGLVSKRMTSYWNDAILGVAGSRPDVGTANIYFYFTLKLKGEFHKINIYLYFTLGVVLYVWS